MGLKLQAKKRDDLKHSTTRQLRNEGSFPAVVYGHKIENQAIAINEADFIKLIREAGRNGVLDLVVEGNDKKHSVMLHDIQTDPLKNEIIHADFIAINLKEEVEVEVTIHLTGEAAGTKEGGVLQQTLHAVNVRALPSDLPEYLELDVSALNIGDTLQVEHFKNSGKYEILDEEETVVVTIVPPTTTEETDEGLADDEEAAVSGVETAESAADPNNQEEATEEDE